MVRFAFSLDLGWQRLVGPKAVQERLMLLLGALPAWPYSRSWGYYPSGGLGLLLVIILLLVLFREI